MTKTERGHGCLRGAGSIGWQVGKVFQKCALEALLFWEDLALICVILSTRGEQTKERIHQYIRFLADE